MAARIYLVTETDTNEQHLVRAHNQSQAVRHVAQTKFIVGVANQDALVSLVAAGKKVVNSTASVDEAAEIPA